MPTASGRTSRAAFEQLEAGHLRHALVGDDHRDVVLRGSASASSPLPARSSSKLAPKLKRKASRLSCSSSTTSTGNFAELEPLRHGATVTRSVARGSSRSVSAVVIAAVLGDYDRYRSRPVATVAKTKRSEAARARRAAAGRARARRAPAHGARDAHRAVRARGARAALARGAGAGARPRRGDLGGPARHARRPRRLLRLDDADHRPAVAGPAAARRLRRGDGAPPGRAARGRRDRAGSASRRWRSARRPGSRARRRAR